MNRRVRIYNHPDGNDANLLGFGLRGTFVPEDPAFVNFMVEHGYTCYATDTPPEGGVSWRYVDVRPPIAAEHLQELGALCVSLIPAGNDDVLLLDNRTVLPNGIYSGGEVITRG